MAIIGIVAIDRNGAIGKGGAIPWHYSSDLKFFKRQTTGNAIVMGFNTWLSLKKPLKDRLNVVLTRERDIEPQDNVRVMRDRESVLEFARTLDCDLFIIGGEQIYRTFMNDIDRWLVTEIPLAVEGADAFIPSGFLNRFVRREEIDLEDGVSVVTWVRASDDPSPVTRA